MSAPDTTNDRRLLAAVSRWRKANGWTDSSRGWIDADTLDNARVIVKADPDATDVFHVTWRKGNGGWHQPRQYDAVDLQQAIDLLVALCILPDRFSSAYKAGHRTGYAWRSTELAVAKRCENCAPGYDCESGIYTPASTR